MKTIIYNGHRYTKPLANPRIIVEKIAHSTECLNNFTKKYETTLKTIKNSCLVIDEVDDLVKISLCLM